MEQIKYAVITGATSGIGRAAAIQFAEFGYSLIILARNKKKFVELQTEIMEKTTSTPEKIRFIECDLSSLDSVRNAAKEIITLNIPISVLINNAGSYYWTRTLTADGYEATFAVCYLSHFLLTNLIMESLKRASEGRIINLASDIHKYFGIDWKELGSERKYQSQKAYGASKTAMVMFTHALSRRLKETHVKVYSVHPGHVKTNMTTEKAPPLMKFFMNLMPGYLSPNEAARSIIDAATNPEYSEETGLYLAKGKKSQAKKTTYDSELQEKLWKISNELVHENFK
jgi:NAD(P)-dependent dehydrogenase (short-subunit alcohol dehydrogenase family)